jgi:hypothetical protein
LSGGFILWYFTLQTYSRVSFHGDLSSCLQYFSGIHLPRKKQVGTQQRRIESSSAQASGHDGFPPSRYS